MEGENKGSGRGEEWRRDERRGQRKREEGGEGSVWEGSGEKSRAEGEARDEGTGREQREADGSGG